MRTTTRVFQIFFNQPQNAAKPLTTSGKSTFHNDVVHWQRRIRSCKLSYPAAQRNSPPIAEALRNELDGKSPGLKFLEISSGSGQHVGYFAPLFPNITFQPTEFDRSLLDSINAYASECPTKNILPPVYVDVSTDPSLWNEPTLQQESFDYMYNANMMHISPWSCSVGLFCAAGKLLKPGGSLITYGPYAMDGILTPESNINFDKSLRSQNPEWGVRDIADLKLLAKTNGLELKRIQEMPSNNKLLSWLKLK